MKRAALILFLLILPSCQFLKKSGNFVCEAHHDVAGGISTAGSYLGGPGNIVADILNATLEIGCRIFKAATAIPADIADGPGTAKETKVEFAHEDYGSGNP